jgi:riboflavin kinase/FMN adenylyltransferase
LGIKNPKKIKYGKIKIRKFGPYFFPHPRMVLQEHSDIKLLNTIDEKIDLLEQIGIENLVIHPFDEAFSRLTAEEFVTF